MYEKLYHSCFSLVASLVCIISTGVNCIISETLRRSCLAGHFTTSRCAVMLTEPASPSPPRVICLVERSDTLLHGITGRADTTSSRFQSTYRSGVSQISIHPRTTDIGRAVLVFGKGVNLAHARWTRSDGRSCEEESEAGHP